MDGINGMHYHEDGNIDPQLLHGPLANSTQLEADLAPQDSVATPYSGELNNEYFFGPLATPFADDHLHQSTYPQNPSLHRRSISQPPEELPQITFHRSGQLLGETTGQHSTSIEPVADLRRQLLRGRSTPFSSPGKAQRRSPRRRDVPYPTPYPAMKAHQRPSLHYTNTDASVNIRPDTSAQGFQNIPQFPVETHGMQRAPLIPQTSFEAPISQQPIPSNPDSNAAIMARLSEIKQICLDTQSTAHQLQIAIDHNKGDAPSVLRVSEEVEALYSIPRTHNAKLTSLDEPFAQLAPAEAGDALAQTTDFTVSNDRLAPDNVFLPANGREVRTLDEPSVDALLAKFGLSCPEDAFAFEKKLVYLRFLGVGRELMHKILD